MPHAKKMTSDKHIRDVFEGQLAAELRIFFQTHLEMAYGANWRDQVLTVLKPHDQQKWKRNPSLDILDFAALVNISLGLTTLQNPWHLELPCVDILHESRKVRNRWTHLPPGETCQPAVVQRDWPTLLCLAQGYRLSETLLQRLSTGVEFPDPDRSKDHLDKGKNRYMNVVGWITRTIHRSLQHLVRIYKQNTPRFLANCVRVKAKLRAGLEAALLQFRIASNWIHSQWDTLAIRTKKGAVISLAFFCILMGAFIVLRNPENPPKPPPSRLDLLNEMKLHDKDFLLCNVDQIDSLIRVNLIPHPERMRIKLESWRNLPCLEHRTTAEIDSFIRLHFGTLK